MKQDPFKGTLSALLRDGLQLGDRVAIGDGQVLELVGDPWIHTQPTMKEFTGPTGRVYLPLDTPCIPIWWIAVDP